MQYALTNIKKNKHNKKFCKITVWGLIIIMLLYGCSKKSEYYINLPLQEKFNYEVVSDLSEDDGEQINNFILEVTKWYNSVDILKPQPIDFVPKDIDEIGQDLFNNEIYQTILNKFATTGSISEDERKLIKSIGTVNGIYGQISEIMMTNELTISLSQKDTDTTIIINKDSWIKLGDIIEECIEFYYK